MWKGLWRWNWKLREEHRKTRVNGGKRRKKDKAIQEQEDVRRGHVEVVAG